MWQWWEINKQFIIENMLQNLAEQSPDGFISTIKMQEIKVVRKGRG